MGARPLSRKINDLIKVPLSKRILFERLIGCTVYVDYHDDNIVFDVVDTTDFSSTTMIDEHGYIRI
jgi:ATP-dependent Clp protease ATP-binding subunit ClpA